MASKKKKNTAPPPSSTTASDTTITRARARQGGSEISVEGLEMTKDRVSAEPSDLAETDPVTSKPKNSFSAAEDLAPEIPTQEAILEIEVTEKVTAKPSDPPLPESEDQATAPAMTTDQKLDEIEGEVQDESHTQPVEEIPPAPPASAATVAQEKPTIKVIQQTEDSKPLWTDLLKAPGRKMEPKGEAYILESGEKCVKIPNSIIEKNKKQWDHFIIGQFYGDAPTRGAVYAIANGIWSPKFRDITVSRLSDKAHLFRIPFAATRNRVLQ